MYSIPKKSPSYRNLVKSLYRKNVALYRDSVERRSLGNTAIIPVENILRKEKNI